MAKRKVNKSKIIRDYYLEHKNLGPTEIAKAITAMGHQVGPALVNQALKSLNPTRRKKGRGRPAGASTAAKKSTSGDKSMVQLNMAADFCKACGGVDTAIEILQTLKSIAAKL